MDGEHVKKEKTALKVLKGYLAYVSDVLPTLWVRLPFQIDNGGNWIVLGGRSYLLWNLRVFLCLLYFAVQIFKQV